MLFLFNCQEDNPGIISEAVLIGIQDNATLALPVCLDTVPLKSKLTLETRSSSLDARNDRGSSLESQVSSIEFRGSRNKVFSDMQKLERVLRKRFISQRELHCSSVLRRSLSRGNIRPCVDCGLNVTFC